MKRHAITNAEVLRLYEEERLSFRQISARIGMSVPGVVHRLREAGYTPRYHRRAWYIDPRLKAQGHPTALDIAWAAGLYEGEGSCVVRKAKPNGEPKRGAIISIAQKERWICDRMKYLFGGHVVHYDQQRTCRPGLTRYHYWRIAGPRARGFMLTIYTFLSPHRKAKIAEAMQVDRFYPRTVSVLSA